MQNENAKESGDGREENGKAEREAVGVGEMQNAECRMQNETAETKEFLDGVEAMEERERARPRGDHTEEEGRMAAMESRLRRLEERVSINRDNGG